MLGLHGIAMQPQILRALDPLLRPWLLNQHGVASFVVLGAGFGLGPAGLALMAPDLMKCYVSRPTFFLPAGVEGNPFRVGRVVRLTRLDAGLDKPVLDGVRTDFAIQPCNGTITVITKRCHDTRTHEIAPEERSTSPGRR